METTHTTSSDTIPPSLKMASEQQNYFIWKNLIRIEQIKKEKNNQKNKILRRRCQLQ